MTLIETCTQYVEEQRDLAAILATSYDGYTPSEQHMTPEQIDIARKITDTPTDPKTLAAAMFQVSDAVKLHFYFEEHCPEVPFGD